MTDIEPLVTVINGRAMVSSMDVARRFGKLHKDVLRSIDKLLKEEPKLRGRNFAPTFIEHAGPNGAVRQERAYNMDRDGFIVLRSIDKLLKEDPKLHGRNFAPMFMDVVVGNGAVRQERYAMGEAA